MLQLVASLVNILELPDSAQISDNDLNAGTGELGSRLFVEHAGERDKAKFPRSSEHLDLAPQPQTCVFQHPSEPAIDESEGRVIENPFHTQLAKGLEPRVQIVIRIAGHDCADDRSGPGMAQDLPEQRLRLLISIAIGQQTGVRIDAQ